MKSYRIEYDPQLAPFVKNIMVFQNADKKATTRLPFFADGYPGFLFHITPNGQWVQPQNKKMPNTYIYGQTLHPIELHIEGAYKIILLQLYPFVLYRFFNIRAADLNNNCFDLLRVESWEAVEKNLLAVNDTAKQIDIISAYFMQVFNTVKHMLDLQVRSAIQLILHAKAQITITELCSQLHITARTLERKFAEEVGISAKNFIQITRFQQSLEQLTVKDHSRLTDIVYANGFADQSHFIRVFKAYTGTTPRKFIQ
jgi:AraC-like DNA-binding protein